MSREWMLTQEEAAQVVAAYINKDFAVRSISVNRGHWEQLVPVLSLAQARKLVEWESNHGLFTVDDDAGSEMVKQLCKDVGLENRNGK